jgi:hypothetical protein
MPGDDQEHGVAFLRYAVIMSIAVRSSTTAAEDTRAIARVERAVF